MSIVGISISLLPVLLFLTGLILLDSFKLVRFRPLLFSLLYGAVVAVIAYQLNTFLLDRFSISLTPFSRYAAPGIEETLKAGFIVLLIKQNRVGFAVDAAIHGFAVGAGFAVIENIYYLATAPEAGMYVWGIRGLGTAIMHGGATTVFALVLKNLADRDVQIRASRLGLSLFAAFCLHSLYNHFILPPLVGTSVLLVVFPAIIMGLFNESEKRMRSWLGSGFDTDQELLGLILSGQLSSTRVGTYLHDLKGHFDGTVIVDMLCLIRIRVELSIRAKGLIMMREAGFQAPVDPLTKSKFEELAYLEDNIGRTGLAAIEPIHRWNRKELWQLHVLKQ